MIDPNGALTVSCRVRSMKVDHLFAWNVGKERDCEFWTRRSWRG